VISSRLLHALAIVAVIFTCTRTWSQVTPSRSTSADSAKGKQIYANYGCYECHGYLGQGSPLSGSRIAPGSVAFTAFENYLRQPGGQMPPYTTRVLTDAQVADIYAFLRSLPEPPDWKDIPILRAESPKK
jgi:ubiquinol-cytochrome c reductase cytochrome c subunit